MRKRNFLALFNIYVYVKNGLWIIYVLREIYKTSVIQQIQSYTFFLINQFSMNYEISNYSWNLNSNNNFFFSYISSFIFLFHSFIKGLCVEIWLYLYEYMKNIYKYLLRIHELLKKKCFCFIFCTPYTPHSILSL